VCGEGVSSDVVTVMVITFRPTSSGTLVVEVSAPFVMDTVSPLLCNVAVTVVDSTSWATAAA
jgi:hypothetical protein